jgi:hypothetical protein
VEQDGDFYRAALGFEGTGAGSANAAQGARGNHTARQRCRGAAMGPARHSRRLPCPTASTQDKVRKGKRNQGRGLTGRSHLAVKQEERWVVDGPAGCVGPKGISGLAV